ncbi:hypothetical protein ABT009_03955 [Streptomyces sp. NPDC002896]|uniref:hypothetical protein n=1 Tax=Streptomyces sp. NPDC002896 TaxID=3154438 RepID=UPI003319EEED
MTASSSPARSSQARAGDVPDGTARQGAVHLHQFRGPGNTDGGWLPLFDQYGVDVVVCGHEHHYERSHPIRGHQPNDTMTPDPAATRTDLVDTTAGTVHLVIGGGGTSIPSMDVLFDTPQCNVITGVGPTGSNGKKQPVYVTEAAPWSAFRDRVNPYGFVAFSVAPGTHAGGITSMAVTYYAVTGLYGPIEPVDTFTLRRTRSDGAGNG